MGAKDINDLKKLIEKQISSQYLQALNSITKKEIFEQLEKNHQVDLPQNLIDQEILLMTQNLKPEEKEKHKINNEKVCSKNKWKLEIISISKSDAGGFKEVIFLVNGNDIYSYLKYESGVHRVQRIPETETQGRVHTSAATVAVLPEAEEVDIQIKETDLRIDVFRAGGPGGQSVNTTDSAVRITHVPSGVVVSQQDEKSQHKNKAKALKILRSRVYEVEKRKKDQERSNNRRSQIGTGDRSERIRTYNFPQGRVTDHRINLTLHKLDEFLSGEIHAEINEQLRLKEQSLKLENLN